MEEVKLFSIDSLLSRPDPIQRQVASFYRLYQPRGVQVKQHISVSLSDTPKIEGKRCSTEVKIPKQDKRQNEPSIEDELGSKTTKRSANETQLTPVSQNGTPYYEKSRKMTFTLSKGLRGYASNGGPNFESGSVICPMDMGRRRDPQISCLPEDPPWGNLSESFAEEFEEDFELNSKPEVEMTIDNITVSLQNSDLWTEFHHRGTEMIINRAGRRMFPRISVRLTGLKPHVVYRVLLFFERSDGRRYKFVNGKWHTTQIMEFQDTSNTYSHPDSPNTGSFWMKDTICFSKLKITNNPKPDGSNVFLQSMYKYIPHVIIEEDDTSDNEENYSDSSSNLQTPASHSRNCYNFCFPVTSFVAVTAYQNEKITHLKIKNNPFAKAFRESGRASLQHIYFGSGSIPQNSEKERFPVYHTLRNAESLRCMPTSDQPFSCYNTRPFMTNLSRMASSDSRNIASIGQIPRRSRLYASNINLAAERSTYLRNHSYSIASVHSRLSSSTSSVLWEDDSAYGSLNSVLDHHV